MSYRGADQTMLSMQWRIPVATLASSVPATADPADPSDPGPGAHTRSHFRST